jgi:chaperonin GroEL
MSLVATALVAPLHQIAENAGKNGAVVEKMVRDSEAGHGYDAANDDVVDMIKAGIIDPKMVTRSAVQNAGSVAGIFLTTEASITEIPEEKSEAPAMPGGGGMPGMGMPGMM